MMLFDIYATENTLSDVSQRLRFDHFQSFRNLLLGRIVDGRYLQWSDYVDAVVNQDKTLSDLSSDLETKVSNRSALDTFIRDLHIISLRIDGLTLQGIADELDLTRERIRQRLAIYSSRWNYSLNPGAGRRFASKEDSLQYSEDENAKAILVANIVRRVRAHPGISIEELGLDIIHSDGRLKPAPKFWQLGSAVGAELNGMRVGVSVRTGVVYAFCDPHCLKAFKKSNRPPWNPGEVTDVDPKQIMWPWSCLYCRWCGMLVYEPKECCLHEVLDCPLYDWWYSLQAHSFVVQFILRSGRRRVPDLLMDQAEDLALLHPEMDGVEMALTLIDRL
jgi:hypothetical protein